MAKNDEGRGGGKMDLNTASREELMELEGVGERTVERLMRARDEMGPFDSMDALAEIDGIGESTVQRLREQLEIRGGGGGGRGGGKARSGRDGDGESRSEGRGSGDGETRARGRSGSDGEGESRSRSGSDSEGESRGRSGSGGGKRASQGHGGDGPEGGSGASRSRASGGGDGEARGRSRSGGGGAPEMQEGEMMLAVRELFLHELSDIYDGERRGAEMLPMLADEVGDERVSTAFREHEEETRQQIENLDRCFEALGEKPRRMTCRPVEGLRQEHDRFTRERPSPEVLTMFALGAESKTEGFEIASYRALVNMAGVMGEEECARLLGENLRQEEAMAERVERMSRDAGREMRQTFR
jgi:competence ComEA-like helix-hairpin-helix protein